MNNNIHNIQVNIEIIKTINHVKNLHTELKQELVEKIQRKNYWKFK